MPQVWSDVRFFWPEVALTIGLLLVVLVDASGARFRDGLSRLVTVVTLLHRTARLEPRQAHAIQTHTGV